MSEQEEDFAAMFEASVKARRFERGQTIEGTIVAFGPKAAFVDVGGKGEAEMVDCAALSTGHLGRLYGLDYAETRLGSQRFMAPD